MTFDDFIKATEAEGYDPSLDRQPAPMPDRSSIDFGTIEAKTGLASLPLRIAHGEHRGPTNGYGIRHIMLGHGEELAAAEFYSVQDFVTYVIDGFDAIYKDDKQNR